MSSSFSNTMAQKMRHTCGMRGMLDLGVMGPEGTMSLVAQRNNDRSYIWHPMRELMSRSMGAGSGSHEWMNRSIWDTPWEPGHGTLQDRSRREVNGEQSLSRFCRVTPRGEVTNKEICLWMDGPVLVGSVSVEASTAIDGEQQSIVKVGKKNRWRSNWREQKTRITGTHVNILNTFRSKGHNNR